MPAIKTILLLAIGLLLNGCVQLSQPAPGSRALFLPQQEIRSCQRARVVFPAGTYTPEIQSDYGVYHLAPTPILVEGVVIGGGYRGGVFVAHDGRHAAWFGDARDDADERAGTLLGAIGAASPKLWLFTPKLPLQAAAH
ncbi:MAG: hypothetical protein ACKO8Z_17390 [Prosthecobacter sp.]